MCALGCLSHTLLAVLGVSALIAASPEAFTALKVCGGLYLVWLASMRCAVRAAPASAKTSDDRKAPQTLSQGIVANAINPGQSCSSCPSCPSSSSRAHGSVAAKMAWLGIIFTVQAGVIFGLLGPYFSGTVGRWINTSPPSARQWTA